VISETRTACPEGFQNLIALEEEILDVIQDVHPSVCTEENFFEA
jgi:hypothetical protein